MCVMGTMHEEARFRVGPRMTAAVVGMSMVGLLALRAAGGTAEAAVAPAGADLPELRNPFGVEVGYYWQDQPYEISQLDLLVGGFPLGVRPVAIDNEVDEYHLKFDWDVLPFLNLFALAGAVDGSTSVQTGMPVLPSLNIEYDGWVYGLGVTAMYGTERFFTSLTAFYSMTDLDVTNSEKDAFVLMPRVGMVFGGWSVWIGAMYQSVEEQHSGTYFVPGFGSVDFNAELQQAEDWNYLAGVCYNFNDSWNLTLEGGFGERESAMVGLQWRF
jgi:hypothetical protein